MLATLTSKGQITIPVSVRSALGLEAGCRIEFVQIAQDRYEIIPAVEPVQSLKGLLPKPKKPVSIAAMNKVIANRGAS